MRAHRLAGVAQFRVRPPATYHQRGQLIKRKRIQVATGGDRPHRGEVEPADAKWRQSPETRFARCSGSPADQSVRRSVCWHVTAETCVRPSAISSSDIDPHPCAAANSMSAQRYAVTAAAGSPTACGVVITMVNNSAGFQIRKLVGYRHRRYAPAMISPASRLPAGVAKIVSRPPIAQRRCASRKMFTVVQAP